MVSLTGQERGLLSSDLTAFRRVVMPTIISIGFGVGLGRGKQVRDNIADPYLALLRSRNVAPHISYRLQRNWTV